MKKQNCDPFTIHRSLEMVIMQRLFVFDRNETLELFWEWQNKTSGPLFSHFVPFCPCHRLFCIQSENGDKKGYERYYKLS